MSDVQQGKRTRNAAATLAALGVVYGDIGTSPLYTIKVALAAMPQAGPDQVLGLLSMLFWLLMLVVTLKYVFVILRADNKGEGGTLALMELARRSLGYRYRWHVYVVGLVGACLFYGDTIVTPAISVLSAVEGIGLISHRFDDWIVPVAVTILAALFLVQSRGTAAVGRFFGPIMLVWFMVLGVLGATQIAQQPEILLALDPRWAISLFGSAPWETYLLLGAIVLALTGAETLYADMGHFGRAQVRFVWLTVVMPALILCYFGQGALVLSDPTAARNPFFLLAPAWATIPLLVLATCATVIASQAVISGAFSVTRQAVQLGFWPRMDIRHTSTESEGQVYLPRVNVLLFMAVVVLVLAFRSSNGLAHAYGFAVTGTMLVTSLLAFVVIPKRSQPSMRLLWVALLSLFFVIDVLLFSANAVKFIEGGWVPLLVGAGLFILMVTWKQGREKIHVLLTQDRESLHEFMEGLQKYGVTRVPGTAVFMSMVYDTVPPALLHNLKHNKVLHQQVIFLTIEAADVPFVEADERYTIESLGPSSWQVLARWGFKQEPNVPALLEQLDNDRPDINLAPMETSFFLSRQTIIVNPRGSLLPRWRQRLFALLTRNATRSTRFFRIPPNRVIEMGMQVELP